ncbi:4'-phosphopantetheinyl transferase family protein [Desulfobacula toluolica]|uniref:Gsp: 4?-phosphopantetheinyl transferase (Gramicidin synthetase-activating enzyme) n=1 Tax=Desulfobacula toluolica (strain DSM 7467 / Tol2) TaxID=651182 RepID=K0NEB4_DESTT|nr:4'-phosphopantetheinyl transferase superfamily protein [Desulfobacula toluolica]CCK79215.1 Gsp: 4?-phosphopantetheinyl transferase (gramicidin synthetase-activating enzyme) [Desulfobacula toluolica Tol2]
MTLTFQNKSFINTLTSKPGIIIWYSRIPDILRSIVSNSKYHHIRPQANEIFKKEDFICPVFSKEEINTINGFKALKKQIEWISGRYLIKQMVQHIFLKTTPLDHITLSYLDQGAPYVTNCPDIPISLSHSNDYTTVACCKNKHQTIGIDIEKITKKPDIFFLKTAFTQNEILNLKDNAAHIFKNWTIKEAYLKYIKKGFNESLHKVEVINNEIVHNQKKINVDVYSTFLNEYVLSLISD